MHLLVVSIWAFSPFKMASMGQGRLVPQYNCRGGHVYTQCDVGSARKPAPECGTVPLSRLQLLYNLTNDSTNGPEVNGPAVPTLFHIIVFVRGSCLGLCAVFCLTKWPLTARAQLIRCRSVTKIYPITFNYTNYMHQ